MARPAADRVKAVWNGTGTGTMTLGGAAPGQPVQAFPAALDGQVVSYMIIHETAQEAEAGYGLYTHSGATLSRLYRFYPTPGGSAVNFSSGTKFVSVTPNQLLTPNFATTDPGVDDDITAGYIRGAYWINTTTPSIWVCVSHTDGAAVWLRIDAASASIAIDQYDILARLTSGSGVAAGVTAADLTEKTPLASGDFILGWETGGALRKFPFGSLPTAGDAAATKVTSNAATFALASTDRLYLNKRIVSHQASVVFEVPQAAAAESEWRIMPVHDGCTVTINGGVGTLSPNPARLVNGGLAIVTVTSNPGSAPVVEVRGEVIPPMTAVTTKTYDLDDHGQDFGATGTQTFNTAAASIPNGYYVNIWNTTAGNITVDGIDADHIIPAHGVVTVKKRSDGALVCNGSGGNTVMDAA
jgi:hypothetical protein